MKKDPIKLTIGLGFAGVLTLMGLINFISLSQLNSITEQTGILLKETNEKISAANTMRDNIRLRGDILYQMFLTTDYIERDEHRLDMAIYALNYKNARDILYNYPMTAREAKLLDNIKNLTRISKSLNDIAAENLLSNLPIKDLQENVKQAAIARHYMLADLDKLVLLQENIAHLTIADNEKYQDSISNLILLLSLTAFFIAMYIAQLVIRETSKKNSEIHFQATHDELTKLANRKAFNSRLKEAHHTAIDRHENHALCFLDLDKFKAVNDSCGHNAGDELLIQITTVIKQNIRSHDILARLGGDEFGLLLEGCSLEKAVQLSEGIVNLIKNYEFHWDNKIFHIGVSIGLVMVTKDTYSVEEALTHADTACYKAKNLGRNQVQVHGVQDDRAKQIQQELSWVANVNNKAGNEHFELHLQAIENIQNEDSPAMFEVLLRLNDGKGTIVSPRHCIPSAERFCLMKNVDYWVIEQTFKHLAHIYKTIPNCDVRLFINISANSLTDSGFSDYVIKQYKKYNISHDAVCLEISEIKASKNTNQTSDVIAALRRYNIKFALDGFGIGISSFSYLKKLPVDYLKIDGEIIKNMSQNTTDKAMIAAINQIGKVMNIEIIAQHVENVFTLNQLKEIGIDYAQGFYIDKPTDINTRIEEFNSVKKQHYLNH